MWKWIFQVFAWTVGDHQNRSTSDPANNSVSGQEGAGQLENNTSKLQVNLFLSLPAVETYGYTVVAIYKLSPPAHIRIRATYPLLCFTVKYLYAKVTQEILRNKTSRLESATPTKHLSCWQAAPCCVILSSILNRGEKTFMAVTDPWFLKARGSR